jgi:hypothetical protein
LVGALDRIDNLAVANRLPWLPAEPIGSFRRAHYPTADLLEPHLTVVFPVPATIERVAFREHVGLFVEERDIHNLLVLRQRAFDRARFNAALQEAEALKLDYAGRVDSMHIFGLDEDMTHVTALEEIQLG